MEKRLGKSVRSGGNAKHERKVNDSLYLIAVE